ncbi:MAG TPA: ECF-type sigma factor [Vicinamibacterales bacterium]
MTQAADSPSHVTRLLKEWSAGRRDALDLLVPAVYGELRRLARAHIAKEQPGRSLQATALVNEAFLRLVQQHQVDWQNRAHFFSIAAHCMRRILVDRARRHKAIKRAHHATIVDVELLPAGGSTHSDTLLAISEALERLAVLDARQAEIFELRYFGGLTVKEISHVTGVSTTTVKRDLQAALIWMKTTLGHA